MKSCQLLKTPGNPAFDSWYAKRELLAHALSYPNLNVICNARHDTAMFELPIFDGRPSRPSTKVR